MKKMLVVALVALGTIAGCTENKLTIINEAEYKVSLNFLGERHELLGTKDGSGAAVSIDVSDIPNGTYPYSTVYSYPAGAEVTPEEGLGGTMLFQRSATEILLVYGSSTEIDTSGAMTYRIFATQSSTDPIAAIKHP